MPVGTDGGGPIGVPPGDLLNILTAPGGSAAFNGGPLADQGSFQGNANRPVSSVRIESLSVSGGGTPVVNGTNGNDAIAAAARDGSYSPRPTGRRTSP